MIALRLIKFLDKRLGIRNRLKCLPPSGFDTAGEKLLDWGWCLANLPQSPRQRVLDIGCCQAPIVPTVVALGHEVVGVDTDRLPYQLPGLTFFFGDFLEIDFPDASFDVVVLCSVVEHIGLAGRYAQRNIPDGDFLAMKKVAQILKPDGRVLLTVPVGKDLIFKPWHRIYGEERLPALIAEFQVERSQYLVKERGEVWKVSEQTAALHVDRQGLGYGLAQFVLKKVSEPYY
jgi:SAM-dependent methyltransferase